MKKSAKRIIRILEYVYAIGIFLSLFIGTLSFFAYLLAIFVGGQFASDICVFIYESVYPIIVYAATISVLIGLLKMYLAGEKALIFNKRKDK